MEMEMEMEMPECTRGFPRGTATERFPSRHVVGGEDEPGRCECGEIAVGRVLGKRRLLCLPGLVALERSKD